MAEFVASTGPVVKLSSRRATFHGNGGALFGIYLRNILLTLLTLGAYYFWGKTRTRTYLAGQCEFDGDRFAWHGTGKELFLGALKLLVIALPIVFLVSVLPIYWKSEVSKALGNVVSLAVYLFLFPLAMVGARRYRMSRLSWRGIRFSFRGRARDFLRVYLRGMYLSAITFGLHYPFYQANVRKFFSNHSYFGNMRFAFDGQGRDLFGRFLATVVVTLAAFGIAVSLFPALLRRLSFSPPREGTALGVEALQLIVPLLGATVVAVAAWLVFTAFRHRYYWGHTSFGTARFRSTMTAGKLFGLALTNLLLVIGTVGLGLPWALVRNVKFGLANITLEGPVDLSSVVQEAQAAGATSESLASMLDIDIFGMGLPL